MLFVITGKQLMPRIRDPAPLSHPYQAILHQSSPPPPPPPTEFQEAFACHIPLEVVGFYIHQPITPGFLPYRYSVSFKEIMLVFFFLVGSSTWARACINHAQVVMSLSHVHQGLTYVVVKHSHSSFFASLVLLLRSVAKAAVFFSLVSS